MLSRNKVRITVVKKTFNQDLADAYTEGEWKPEGCCHAFEVGHEWITDGHMSEGFSDTCALVSPSRTKFSTLRWDQNDWADPDAEELSLDNPVGVSVRYHVR